MYDVAIVGAGPAGATAARLLRSGLRVLLIDRRTLEASEGAGGPAKLCGGLLAPQAQRELVRQGLGVPGHVIEGPQLFGVRTVDVDADLERVYQRFYVNVDRECFDRWLVSLVPRSVERAFGWNVVGGERTSSGVRLTCRTPGGGRASVLARVVVGADGASSVVRRRLVSTGGVPRRYAGLQAAFEAGGGDAHYGAVFDAGLTDFYGWTIPKGDRLLVGAAFPIDADAAGRFDAFLGTLRDRGWRLGGELTRAAATIARPASLAEVLTHDGDVALVGEAAGFISPSSAEGISYALRSGRLLAEQANASLDEATARYGLATTPLRADIALRLLKASAIYGPVSRRLIMASGAGAIPGRPTAHRLAPQV